MKKRVLKIAALLMAAVGFAPQAQADTDLLTQEKGYTKITQMPADENLDDYYFIIVDKNNDLMVSQENKMWYYKTSVDPTSDSKKVWMIEKGTAENSYAFRNMAEPTYLIEAGTGAGWDFIVKTSATPNDNTSFICTYTDNNWILESVVNSGEYIGPWNNESNTMDGERLAANKSETQRGYFVLYSIERATFDNQELAEAKSEATAEIADYEAILNNSTAESEVSTAYSKDIRTAKSDVNGATDTEAVDAAMAALVASLAVLDVSLIQILAVSVPAFIVATFCTCLSVFWKGTELEKDPEFIRRVQSGQYQELIVKNDSKPFEATKAQKLSVGIFLVGFLKGDFRGFRHHLCQAVGFRKV